MLKDPLPVKPFSRPPSGAISVPGSKSITNRALIMAALCPGKVVLENALFSRDTRIMIKALSDLGFVVTGLETDQKIVVEGLGGRIPNAHASIHVGNAGTAARFLTAFLATREGGSYELDGDMAMRSRPMGGLLQSLATQGCSFSFHEKEEAFPFEMKTNGLQGGSVSVDARSSSQLLSALLIASPVAARPVKLSLQGETVSRPFVTLTLSMMEQFGISAAREEEPGNFLVQAPSAYALTGGHYLIEPDATAASYFLALPVVAGGKVGVKSLGNARLQGDLGFIQVLSDLGVIIEKEGKTVFAEAGDSVKDRIFSFDFTSISDTFLTLAAIAPLLPLEAIRINGIAHTRRQETDRIDAMATELRKMGQGIEEGEDYLTIKPNLCGLHKAAREGLHVDTYEDHRVAMSFAILGSYDLLKSGEPWLFIRDPGCCGKTFPGFFDVLESLH